MRSSAGKIQMTDFDSLFQTGAAAEVNGEQVQEVALTELFPFKNHPFQVKDDDAMLKMAESIAKYGVLVPGIARPRTEGGYELIAGHRRKRGSELAGNATMPMLIQNLDDDEATIVMVDSNLQREKLLPSEKAFAYKMKVEALKHQGERRDLTSARGVLGLTSRDQVAQDAGEKSGMSVTRYISLTKLIPPLLAVVDDGKLSVSSAADYLSDLSEQGQTDFLTATKQCSTLPSKEQMVKIRKYSRDGTLTLAVMEEMLVQKRQTPVQITLKKDRLKQYFPQTYTQQQMEEIIISLLEAWKARHE